MPKIKLTAKVYESLKPVPNSQVDYYDLQTPGMYVRVSQKGKDQRIRKSFAIVYYFKGRQ